MNGMKVKTYSIFWLDTSVNNEENMAAQTELRSIINRVRNSANPEEFMQSVHLIRQGDLTFLIVSGQLGCIVVPEMQNR
ncbi:unnamed protein product [Rotaria socialis]|uniref:Uncharacterized protein n=1 Tax=Rotaria socialis TaxID=392032 RepID=A0A819W618_9BILA|nr:unnamed protein product [Rotaria socialis]CAF3638440.1 unnamed protein product [Rotaria socialis]CAF4119700.1 unnamed protein product [Rotaria socialis]CAF4260543.1 unnamed protein product [Rotaria socialis]